MTLHNPRRPSGGNNPLLRLPIFESSRTIIIFAAVSIMALVLLAGLFLREARAQTLSRDLSKNATEDVSSGVVYLSPSEQAMAQVPSTKKAPMLEVHVANNGLMLLRGARVITVSGSTVRVGMTWGSADFTWKIETDSGTKFLTSEGEKETLRDIKVGDIVTVTGKLSASGEEPTIGADFMREQQH